MIQSTEEMIHAEGRTLLAMVSQYTDKYFWNEELGKLPEEIRKEVLVLLIMVTEEAGGITVMGFEADGEVYLGILPWYRAASPGKQGHSHASPLTS